MTESGLGERDLHVGLPGAEPSGIAQRDLELAAGLGQACIEQRNVGPGVGRAGPAPRGLALVFERLAQVTLRERIARLERTRAVFVEPRDVFEVGRLAGVERARFAQPVARAGPFLNRRLAALRFPGSDEGARFEAAQVGETARQRECGEPCEGGEKNAARNQPQLGLAVLPLPPPPAPALPVGVL